jgi:hypothetical protein
MKTIKTLAMSSTLALLWTVSGFAQTTTGSTAKDGNGKAATGSYSRKKMPGRMKSGQLTAKEDSKSGNQKQPDMAVKGTGVPKDSTK